MKGNEVTAKDIERWKSEGMIPTACRLCGKIDLYPLKFFKPKDLKDHECANCKMMMRLFGR